MNDSPGELIVPIIVITVMSILGGWVGNFVNDGYYKRILLENKLGEWKIQDESSGDTEFVIFTRDEIEKEFEVEFRKEIEEELARQLIKDVNSDSSYLLEWKDGVGPLLDYSEDKGTEDIEGVKDTEDTEDIENTGIEGKSNEVGNKVNNEVDKKGVDNES